MRIAALGPIFCATLLLSSSAFADLAVPGIKQIPLELTLENQRAFPGTEVVILGCNSADGRHAVGFPKPGEPLLCRLKHAPRVYVVQPKEAAELRELVAKNIGWGYEGEEARKILESKAKSCGGFTENTSVSEFSKETRIQATYRLAVTGTQDCEVKKSLASPASPSQAPEPLPSTATPPAPTNTEAPSSSPTNSATPPANPPKSGCAGCSTRPTKLSLGWVLAIVVGLGIVWERRRARRGE